MSPGDPLTLATAVAAVLDRLGIRYVIGGSVASSIWGEPRTTIDLDLMIEADEEVARLLARALHDDYYVDEQSAVTAAEQEGSFNAVHFETSMKIDFFIAEQGEISKSQLRHRRAIEIGGSTLYFYAPEDLIVRKLMWFRLGGGQSERQWRDIVGVLRVSRPLLDREYLAAAASQAGVAELLERAEDDTDGAP